MKKVQLALRWHKNTKVFSCQPAFCENYCPKQAFCCASINNSLSVKLACEQRFLAYISCFQQITMKLHSITAFPTRRHWFFSIRFTLFVVSLLLVHASVFAQKRKAKSEPSREYIQLKIYHAADAAQMAAVDAYLKSSFIPLLEKNGFSRTGVFAAAGNDTASDKRMYVLIPFKNLLQLEKLVMLTNRSLADSALAPAYTKAAHNKPAFTRMESILLQAFSAMPVVKPSGVKSALDERVFELRSYESATEAQHLNKVQMFNEGEVQLFDRLGFNAVFYGQVIAGCRMPNLMYITSFDNKAARDEHWKTFGGHPDWKAMSSLPQYQNNVSKIDITFLKPVSYSRL